MKRLLIEPNEVTDCTVLGIIARTTILMQQLNRNQDPASLYDIVIDPLKNEKSVREKIKVSDELYFSPHCTPTIGYGSSVIGANIFATMVKWMISDKIAGKKMYLFRDYKSIRWSEMPSATDIENLFHNNELYTTDSIYLVFKRVDINQLLEFEYDFSKPVEIVKAKSPKKKK